MASWFQRFRAFSLGRTLKEMNQEDCPHNNVDWLYVQPVTLLPKTGKCKSCGKHVKARIIWE